MATQAEIDAAAAGYRAIMEKNETSVQYVPPTTTTTSTYSAPSPTPAPAPTNALATPTVDTASKVANMYQTYLGRSGEADQAGIDYWENEISSGRMTEDQVASTIQASPEAIAFQTTGSTQAPTASTTLAAPTPAPMTVTNIEPLPAQTTIEAPATTPAPATIEAPAQTAEPQYTQESIDEYVNYMYATELGRTPTQEDMAYWGGELLSGNIDENTFSTAFLDASRQKGETTATDTELIRDIYSSGFGEEATTEELDYWIGEINSGNISPSDMAQAIGTAATEDQREFDKYAVDEKFTANYMEAVTGYSQDMQPFSYDPAKAMMPGYDPDAQFTFDETDPSYQFRQEEGQKAIERSQAAKGNLLSGRAVKEAERYASDLASQEYGNAFSRWQSDQLNQFNMGQTALSSDYNRQLTDYNTQQNQLINLANYGVGAMGATQQASNIYGSQIGNALTQSGQAQAAGYIGAGDATAQMYGNVAGATQQGVSNAMLYNMYNQ